VKIYRGILTGYNDAFIIDGAKKDELISADPKSAEIIRPILRGRDIKKYAYEHDDQWLIFVPWHFPLHKDTSIQGVSKEAEKLFQVQYPAVYKHLLSYKTQLSNRNKAETGIRYEWYALQRWGANYSDDFSRQKIIWGEISDKPKFALDETGKYYVSNTVFFMTGDNLEYLIAFLNSKLSEYYFSQIATTTGVGTVRWLKYKIEQLPVPNIKNAKYDEIKKLHKLVKNGSENSNDIDDVIFDLFSFTSEECKHILDHSSNSSI